MAGGQPAAAVHPLDVASVRAQFPILERKVNGRPLCYLDSAATTQRPTRVLDAVREFSMRSNANVHRGMHTLSIEATEAYESARGLVAEWLGGSAEELVFTRGTTEAINLVASSWGSVNLKPGDRVLVSEMEHHSNIVPWQLAAERTEAGVVPIPVTDAVEFDMEALGAELARGAKLVAIKHVCNATGTVNPVREVARMAHEAGALVLVDGAQALAHVAVDVQELGVDFYAVSSHKAYGPTGIGALWARRELLEAMPPYQGGGEMIEKVSLREGTTFAEPPMRFEAGTPNFAAAVGFAEAIRFLQDSGLKSAAQHENDLRRHANHELRQIDGVHIVGSAKCTAPIVSFVTDWAHPHDVAQVLDAHGVAVRAGHHCCMPLMDRLGLAGTTRASFALYSTMEDVERLITAMHEAKRVFG